MDGPDDQFMKIIYRLRGGSSSLEEIAIYGRGGMGKTTLARNAYNHPLILEHFDISAWSAAPDKYDLQIASDLLRSMKAKKIPKSRDEVFKSLRNKLQGKRYLIVLDDVSDFNIFGILRSALPDNTNGSRIMLTTTSFSSLKFVYYLHEMGLFDVDKIWDQLRAKIFRGDPCPSQLEHLGKKIAISCRGNPLSIRVISGILAADRTEAAWEDFAQHMNTILSENVWLTHANVASLSYKFSPHHLRPCFLYLGCFPGYREIHVSKLIKLWAAEGFLNQSECKSSEETGEELVEDLARRSIVSVRKRKSNGRIKSIYIDNVMRDMCLRQARIDNFVLDVTRFSNFDRQDEAMELQWCRRVSSSIDVDDILEGVYGSTIRTILLYYSGQLGIIRRIGNVTLLRILDLSNAYNYDLPEQVFDLFHLRYLAFHSGFSISEAISNLENLQTLIICPRENGVMFDKLPEGIWRMPQLRHLLMLSFKLPSQKGATSALENPQMLSRVVDFICSRENLKMIPNLKKLALLYTNNFRDVVEDYELHNLIYLQKLEILKIEMDWSFMEQHEMSCSFPPTLKKLSLRSVRLAWEDMKIVASLPNLQVLKLRKHACVGERWETSEGGFSELSYLLIEESNLVHWITESSHFPRLKSLVLHCCLSLLGVPYDMVRIPTLEYIKLDDKNHYSLLPPAKQINVDRQSLGYDPLHVRLA